MPRDPLIGLVGKPSSGKSTTLNRFVKSLPPVGDPDTDMDYSSLTDASSKVGKSTLS